MTRPRFALIVLCAAFVVAGAHYGLGALSGDLASLVVADALFVLAGFAAGWVAHGVLTDAIIERCKAITERHYVEAQGAIARAEGRCADEVAAVLLRAGEQIKAAEGERDAAVAAMGRAVEREAEEERRRARRDDRA